MVVPIQNQEPPAPASPRRLALYVVLGAFAVYFATWTGNVAFYFGFQKTVLAQTHLAPAGVLSSEPQSVNDGLADWTTHEVDGFQLPLPPGTLVKVDNHGTTSQFQFEEGDVVIDKLPAGSLARLFRDKISELGGRAGQVESDVELLQTLMTTVPAEYQFTWSAAKRTEYAARILCKMLLWESAATTRIEAATRNSPSGFSVLVEYESGKVKAISAGPSGVIVVVMPPTAPADWKKSPSNWLLSNASRD